MACGAVRQTLTTDERGAFLVRGLPAGPCTVSAEAPLFAPSHEAAFAGRSGTLTLTLAIRDLGLVKNGILQATGETLALVQNRLLGTATTGTLFEETPGFFVVGFRPACVFRRWPTSSSSART